MDLFGNQEPVQIEDGEWWFNGRIIQRQDDSRLPTWISHSEESNDPEETLPCFVEVHTSMKEAIKFAISNPTRSPKNLAKDYL